LTVCRDRYSRWPISTNVRLGGEIHKQPELGGRQAHSPGAGRAGRRRHALAQLPYLLGEGADVWATLEHPFGIGQDRASGGSLAQCEMDAGELEPDLDAEPGEAVVEQRPQTVDARNGRASIRTPSFVERDPCHRNMHDRVHRVVVEARSPTAPGLSWLPCGLAPRTLPDCQERDLCLRGEGVVHSADGQPRVRGRGQVGLRPVGGAEYRIGDSTNEQRARSPAAPGAN
jgi:hypothetical protein